MEEGIGYSHMSVQVVSAALTQMEAKNRAIMADQLSEGGK